MTELRKRILHSILKKEESKIEKEISTKIDEFYHLTDTFEDKMETLVLCLKYNIYSKDLDNLRKIDKLTHEYKELKESRSNFVTMNAAILSCIPLSLISPFGEVKIFGYCLINLLNSYKELYFTKDQTIYYNQRYKLVKKELRNRKAKCKSTMNMGRFSYFTKRVCEQYVIDVDRINDEINKLYCTLDKMELLYDSKISYIDGKFQPIYENNNEKESNKLLDQNEKNQLFPSIKGKVRIKTLKNKIEVR